MPITHHQVPRQRRRGRRSTLPRFGILLATIGCLLLAAGAGPAAGAPPAPATPPFYLQSQITDQVNALGSQKDSVQQALDDLSSSQHVIMYVVYVSSFDQLSGPDWATQTANKSGLGGNNLLFAVATVDHAYGYARPKNFRLTQAQMDSINSSQVEPKLQQGDWAGATIAAANGYQNALAGGSSGGTGSSGSSSSHANLAWVWLLLLVAVVVAGFLWFRSRFRRGRRRCRRSGRVCGAAEHRPAPGALRPTVRAQRQCPHPDRQRRAGQQERAGPRRGRIRR